MPGVGSLRTTTPCHFLACLFVRSASKQLNSRKRRLPRKQRAGGSWGDDDAVNRPRDSAHANPRYVAAIAGGPASLLVHQRDSQEARKADHPAEDEDQLPLACERHHAPRPLSREAERDGFAASRRGRGAGSPREGSHIRHCPCLPIAMRQRDMTSRRNRLSAAGATRSEAREGCFHCGTAFSMLRADRGAARDQLRDIEC